MAMASGADLHSVHDSRRMDHLAVPADPGHHKMVHLVLIMECAGGVRHSARRGLTLASGGGATVAMATHL